MATPAETGETFSIGAPKDYLGGHVAIGMITLLEAAIPITLYYAWMHPRIDDWAANTWYKYSWKAAAYGHFITFIIPFLFWCLSFMAKNTMSYLYVGMLLVFGSLFGGYVVATTVIYQFQAIKGYSAVDGFEKWEIWTYFGLYAFTQVLFQFIGEHYFLDSIFYLLSSNVKEWCEAHPGVCKDYGVLDMA